jgi:hypothetical protein
MLVLGGEYGAMVRAAGWSRERLQQELHVRSDESFSGPDRILLVYAGGDAGLFAMLFGGWVSGAAGSTPQTGSIEPWR